MLKFIRQPSRRLHLWLMAAVGVLLLTSIIEAGHVHGIFTEANDHCVLCEHSTGHAQAADANLEFDLPLLVGAVVLLFSAPFITRLKPTFAFIRAPPAPLP